MTRVRLSICILAVLITISAVSGRIVDDSCSRLIASSDHVWELYASGRREAAYQEAERLEQDWEGFRKGAAVLLDNGKLTEIDRVCSRVVFLVESDSEELHSELMELRHMAEALRAGELPFLTSIL